MSRSYYLAADLCLRAQRDNLLGKLCWFPAKAICNTQFESEEQAEQENKPEILSQKHVFFVLNEGNARMDTNWPPVLHESRSFLSNTVGDDGQK